MEYDILLTISLGMVGMALGYLIGYTIMSTI
jgi:hypothetical protein